MRIIHYIHSDGVVKNVENNVFLAFVSFFVFLFFFLNQNKIKFAFSHEIKMAKIGFYLLNLNSLERLTTDDIDTVFSDIKRVIKLLLITYLLIVILARNKMTE